MSLPTIRTAAVLAGLLILPVAAAAQPEQTDPRVYAAYAAAADAVAPEGALGIALRAAFLPYPTWTDYRGLDGDDLRGVPPNLPRLLTAPFLHPAPAAARTLRAQFPLARPYTLVTPEQLVPPDPPGVTFVQFSPLVVNPGGQRALVRVVFSCGPDCSRVAFVELRRRGAGWRLAAPPYFPGEDGVARRQRTAAE